MGRFAIQSSPRLSDLKTSESMTELARNNSVTESTSKTNSRFKRASDESVNPTDSSTGVTVNGNSGNFFSLIQDSTRGRFHISSVESVDKIAIPGVDPELLVLAMQDPAAGISHLSLEEKYSYLLNHCNKQSGLIEQLISIIRRNSGGSLR
jgi:hypothetical protein